MSGVLCKMWKGTDNGQTNLNMRTHQSLTEVLQMHLTCSISGMLLTTTTTKCLVQTKI